MSDDDDDGGDDESARLPPLVEELSGAIFFKKGASDEARNDKRSRACLREDAESILHTLKANADLIDYISSDGMVDDSDEAAEKIREINHEQGLAFARWMRMNDTSRYEVSLPRHGQVGPVVLLNMISRLHEFQLQELEDEEKVASAAAKWRASTLSTKASSRSSKPRFGLHSSKTHPTPVRSSSQKIVTPVDAYRALLMESFDRQELLTRKLAHAHVPVEEFWSAADKEALMRVARRLLADIGTKAGSEFFREHGADLGLSVLHRAHATANGIDGSIRFLRGNLRVMLEALILVKDLADTKAPPTFAGNSPVCTRA